MTRTALALLLLHVALATLATLACSGGGRLPRTARGDEVLQVRGAKGGPYRLGEADLATLRHRTLRGIDPASGQEATYDGVDLYALVDRLELRAGVDTLVLRTADGQAIPVPLTVIQAQRPVLVAGPGTSRVVAWPNVEHHGLRSDPRAALWWARGVNALELVSWTRTYGRALQLVEASPADARAGATAFGARCMACHPVRGAGGRNAPALARPGHVPSASALAALLPGHPGGVPPQGGPADRDLAAQLASFLDVASRTSIEEAGLDDPAPVEAPPEPAPLAPAPGLP